jgi:Trk K+ transport system NAD-binding subunit
MTAAMALAAFGLGVEASERPGIPASLLGAQIYYVIGLFFLGGLDLGVPTGGPTWARVMLWFAYFVAPAITTGAVVEGLLRTVKPAWWMERAQRDHLVIVGAGRLGMAYVEAVRKEEPDRVILLVGLDAEHANVTEAQTRFDVHFHHGDITHLATRQALHLDRCHGVALLTKHDIVNLEASADIGREFPDLKGRIVVHVADLGMQRTIDHQLRESPGRGLNPAMADQLFNSHQVAAESLYRTKMAEHFHSTERGDVVVLAGFGRFGQTILETLQNEAAGDLQTVVIVDLHAEKAARLFHEQVGFKPGYQRKVISGDVADPATWDLVRMAFEFDAPEGDAPPPFYVLACSNDELNLSSAVWLRRRADEQARIVVRCFRASLFARTLADEAGFEVFGIASLLRRSLRARHVRWFGE